MLSLFRNLLKIWRPAIYQGSGKSKRYFEGWYFKTVSKKGDEKLAIIPGIAFGKSPQDSHSFIQLIDGKNGNAEYIRFGTEDFSYSKTAFEIRIAENFFSERKVRLNLLHQGKLITGTLRFSNTRTFPVSLLSPGIMGWYRFVPFMECYHGLVSMNHDVSGKIIINDRELNFDKGLGYIEKDWGKSFPSSWIWMHSNHFDKPNTSFFFSLAKIPWFGNHFNGFLCVLLLDEKFLTFATYTGAKVQSLEIFSDSVSVVISDKQHVFKVAATRTDFVILKAPVNGAMDRRMSESMNATVHLSLSDAANKILFEGTGVHAGLDMVGEVNELKPR